MFTMIKILFFYRIVMFVFYIAFMKQKVISNEVWQRSETCFLIRAQQS